MEETCLLIQRRMRRAFRPRRRPWNSSRLQFTVQPRISSPFCVDSNIYTYVFVHICIRRGKRYFLGTFGRMECTRVRVGKGGKYRFDPGLRCPGNGKRWLIDPLIIPRISRERTRELDRVARVYTGFERYYGVGRGQDTLYESFRYFCILLYFPRTLAYTRNNK